MMILKSRRNITQNRQIPEISFVSDDLQSRSVGRAEREAHQKCHSTIPVGLDGVGMLRAHDGL